MATVGDGRPAGDIFVDLPANIVRDGSYGTLDPPLRAAETDDTITRDHSTIVWYVNWQRNLKSFKLWDQTA